MAMILAALLIAGAQNEGEPAMKASDPAALEQSLREMGYAPDPMDMSTDTPSTVLAAGGGKFWLAMGGCERRRNCAYLVVGAAFKDVVDPPASWVNEQNYDLDLVKLWTNEKKELAYGANILTTGLTRAQFRAFIDALVNSENVIGRRAVEAKLTQK
jgi:hypothetical protein